MKTIKNWIRKFYFQIIVAVLAVIVLFEAPNSERMGDRLQYALPLIGLTCSFELKEAGQYASFYFLGLGAVHATKNGLPDKGINLRPDGGGNGFPSGHSYSSAFGAAYIARECANRIPYLGPIALIGAAYTGATRVEAEKHNSFQVLFGFIYATVFELALRRRKLRKKRAMQLNHK